MHDRSTFKQSYTKIAQTIKLFMAVLEGKNTQMINTPIEGLLRT